MEDLRTKIMIIEDKKFSDNYLNEVKWSMASALSIQLVDESEIKEMIVKYLLGYLKNSGTIEAVRLKIKKNLGLVNRKEEINIIINII